MTDEEKKDPEEASKQTAWEDSPTAASLPKWWHPDEEPTQPVPAQKPAAPPPMPAAAPPPAAPPAAAAPAAPTEAPVNWDVSPTAKELPTWWRPEQPPATPAQHASPTVPPAPREAPPPAMTPQPAMSAPPPPPAPPMQVPASPPPPPAPAAPAAPVMPPSSTATPGRHERTMVLGVMPTAGPPMAILVVKSGPDMGFKFRIRPTAVATIGRDLECDVVLDDPAASRRHAHIEFKDGAYTLTDLGSANGTLVNDQRVSERRLSDGDRILVGQDEIVISIM